jgi:hypothetical protein
MVSRPKPPWNGVGISVPSSKTSLKVQYELTSTPSCATARTMNGAEATSSW